MNGWEKRTAPFEFKRDPRNGFFIGPKGRHYEFETEAMHFDQLDMCGCGQPERVYNFLRSILVVADRREQMNKPSEWRDLYTETQRLMAEYPDLAAESLLHFLTDKDVITHGGSVGGSWCTGRGLQIVDLGEAPAEWPINT